MESIRNNIAGYNNITNAETTDINNDENVFINFPENFPTIKETEDSLIREALKRANGNQTIAADLLGISRRALNNRLRRADDKGDK
ncbi:MAG: helix-turn-helix domain-containing protein [Ignavibacteriaceae bacterium]